jgi:hypothetical protein
MKWCFIFFLLLAAKLATTLGVIFKVGTSEPTYIQRVYIINNSLEKGQELLDKMFHPNFALQTRKKCEGHDE